MAKTPDNQDPPAQLSGEMLTAHLLGMLKDWNAYGYDLVQRLNESGLGEYNKGSIYRTLRHMEATGLVSSIWDTSASGPAKRMYSLTLAGTLFLQNWLALIDVHRGMLEGIFDAGTTRKTRKNEA